MHVLCVCVCWLICELCKFFFFVIFPVVLTQMPNNFFEECAFAGCPFPNLLQALSLSLPLCVCILSISFSLVIVYITRMFILADFIFILFDSFHLLSSHEFYSLLMSIDVFIANVIIIFYAHFRSLSLSFYLFLYLSLLFLLLVHYNFIYHFAINSAQQKHSNN